jgi:hypothetical protein
MYIIMYNLTSNMDGIMWITTTVATREISTQEEEDGTACAAWPLTQQTTH